jgi:chorismate mutase
MLNNAELLNDTELSSLREEIDQLDEQLWEVIGKRAEIVRQIGEWKHLHSEQIVQPERWQQVLQHCKTIAEKHGLDEVFVEEVMQAIHNKSVRMQS